MIVAIQVRGVPVRALTVVAGVIYLAIIGAGVFNEAFVRGGSVVSGEAAATAANIAANEGLWRFGLALEQLMLFVNLPLLLILYVLLRPANRDLALLLVFFGLVTTALESVADASLLAPVFLLADAPYLAAFTTGQLQALTYLSLRWHSHAFGVDLIFFAGLCLTLGYLIWHSGFLPRALGALMALAGVAYLVNSFALLAYPPLARALYPWVLLVPLVGEGALALWLLFRGVDLPAWERKAQSGGFA